MFGKYCLRKRGQGIKVFNTFIRFFLVGTLVGVFTIILREGIAFLMPDRPVYFILSIIISYTLGVIISYILNTRFTFRKDKSDRTLTTKYRFAYFTLVSLFGVVSTTVFSFFFRYVSEFNIIFGKAGDTFAFALGAVLTSVITFFLNSKYVFPNVVKDRTYE